MKINKKKGFTLVELLAVIVILAIILVIAVPKVMSVIEDSKKATLESTAKMIASAAEKAKVQNTILGKDETITCESVAKINSLDYESCSIEFVDNTAVVTIKGKGKFAGLNICDGNKTESSATSDECGLICEYGKKTIAKAVVPYEVKNYDSCVSYLTNELPNYGVSKDIIQETIPTLCSGEPIFEMSFSENIEEFINWGFTEVELIENNVIKGTIEETCLEETPESCFAFDSESGTITGYNIDCGTDVVIPEKINNVTVTIINYDAFTVRGEEVAMLSSNNEYEISNLQSNNENIGLTPIKWSPPSGIGITSVVLPNTLTKIGDGAFSNNLLSRIIIPSSVTSIDTYAFYDNPLTNVYLGNQNATIGYNAFGCQDDIETHNLPSSYAGTCE